MATSRIVCADKGKLGWLGLRHTFPNVFGNLRQLCLSIARDRFNFRYSFIQISEQFRIERAS